MKRDSNFLHHRDAHGVTPFEYTRHSHAMLVHVAGAGCGGHGIRRSGRRKSTSGDVFCVIKSRDCDFEFVPFIEGRDAHGVTLFEYMKHSERV